MSHDQADLANQKLAAEVEKLRLENAQSRQSRWRAPTVVATVAGLILSLIGNVSQYRVAQQGAQNASHDLALREERWSEERQKLQAEVAALKQNMSIVATDRSAILAELDDVKRDIAVWDAALFQDQIQLKLHEAQLGQYISAKREEMAEAMRKNIALSRETIEFKTKERADLLSRRGDLETRLGVAR